MKRTYPLLMLLFFALMALWTSVQSYKIAQRDIDNDLRHALTLTKAEAPSDWFTTDTIRQFRSHIVSPVLREDAQLAFLLSDDGRLRVRGYVSYSSFQIWRMSDQRWSCLLGLMSLMSMVMFLRMPRRTSVVQGKGHGASEAMHLTPMQERLMDMFLSSPCCELTKQEICDTLWPGKPDASETLYTLIRRTKQTLGETGTYRIESNRGRSYRLKKI